MTSANPTQRNTNKYIEWLIVVVCIVVVAVSIVMVINLVRYLMLPSRPEPLYITVVNPPNSSLVLELASIEISRSGDTAPSVLVSIRNTDTVPHSGRVEVVAYRTGCGEDLVAYGETVIEVPPNRTATAIVELRLKRGYRARDINSVVVALHTSLCYVHHSCGEAILTQLL